nr:hypothetical protein [Dokdonia sinensis]
MPTIRGTRKTVATCDELYGKKHHKNGPENAFRHALWNVLIVRRSLDKNLPLDKSLAWAKTITDWHEDFSPNSDLARAMDLHNNRVGRDLIAEFPKESEDFLVGQLLKMVPLSRHVLSVAEVKRTQKEQLKEDNGVLVHIED